MRYRKKPIVIEAIQVDGTSKQDDEIREWSDNKVRGHWSNKQWARDNGGHKVLLKRRMVKGFNHIEGVIEYNIDTREGTMLAEYGDWIIKEPFGTDDRQFYPCKPDIFEQTYEASHIETGGAVLTSEERAVSAPGPACPL